MKFISVVVGILLDHNKKVCITQRQVGQHLPGKWEFPGGKVDEGESQFKALVREFDEELGVQVQAADHAFDIKHDYPEKSVHLHIWTITSFDGEAVSKEGQALKWIPVDQLERYDFPEANGEILAYLKRRS